MELEDFKWLGNDNHKHPGFYFDKSLYWFIPVDVVK